MDLEQLITVAHRIDDLLCLIERTPGSADARTSAALDKAVAELRAALTRPTTHGPEPSSRLVISRRAGELLWIGDEIQVEVTDLQSHLNQVRLAVMAPRRYRVDREEVRTRRLAEKASRRRS